jgi:hypothetical protein
MTSRRFLGVAVAGTLLLMTGTASAHPMAAARARPTVEGWERNHPEASRELGAWVREHPDAARKFFEWDAARPERARAFVTWSITHPGEGIGAFADAHRGWEHFDAILRDHQPAASAFMAWCRRRPQAAEALMKHPGGLDWAGHHLYAAFWNP